MGAVAPVAPPRVTALSLRAEGAELLRTVAGGWRARATHAAAGQRLREELERRVALLRDEPVLPRVTGEYGACSTCGDPLGEDYRAGTCDLCAAAWYRVRNPPRAASAAPVALVRDLPWPPAARDPRSELTEMDRARIAGYLEHGHDGKTKGYEEHASYPMLDARPRCLACGGVFVLCEHGRAGALEHRAPPEPPPVYPGVSDAPIVPTPWPSKLPVPSKTAGPLRTVATGWYAEMLAAHPEARKLLGEGGEP